MKKIYLLGLASIVALGVNAQTTLKVKNPSKKVSGKTEKAIGSGSNSVQAITGSITCSSQYNPAGGAQTLNFNFAPTNTDAEYVDYLEITFPAGITPVTSANNPFAPITDNDPTQDPPAQLNPVAGQVISWGTNTNSQYGAIESLGNAGGVTSYNFSVDVMVTGGLSGTQVATFLASGDGFGATPADLNGTINIFPQGTALVNLRTVFVQPFNLTSLNVCSYGLDTIFGQIKNIGNTAESNITVNCTVNGVAQTPFVIPGPIAAGDSSYFGIIPGYNFNASADYNLVAYVAQASDIDLTNDTAKLTFNNAIPTNLTSAAYANGCEAGFEFNSINRAFVSGDGYIFGPSTATVQSGTQALFYTVPNTATAGVHEAMAILPCVDVTMGDVYRITFYKRINGTAAAVNGQSGVFTGTSSDPAAMTTILKPYAAITPYAAWIKDSVDYIATATETRYFALGGKGTVVATSNQINVRYDNINITKVTPIGIKENAATEAISVFPNPSAGIFTVKTIENNSAVSVYSIIGENVFNSTLVKGNNTVDLSNVAAGTYIVKVQSGNTTTTKRIVINK